MRKSNVLLVIFLAFLDYVEMLNQVDVTDEQPTYQVSGNTNVMRKDEEQDYGYKTEDLLKNAPSVKDGQFKVRRVL